VGGQTFTHATISMPRSALATDTTKQESEIRGVV